MLEYMDEQTSDKQFYFGTDDFDHVWEKLIDRALEKKTKRNFFLVQGGCSIMASIKRRDL